MKRRLPIGIQDFITIRQEGYIYIDKTVPIHKLMTGSGKTFFLSRPRRFGKSLLCSTMSAIFEGRRELFKAIAGQGALAIDGLDWDWKPSPVVRIDLNAGDFIRGIDELYITLNRALEAAAAKNEVPLTGANVSDRFARLLAALHDKSGEKAAVIIDEYDKPLLNTMEAEEIHSEMLSALKAFYGVLKTCDEHLRFAFITGVTKFSGISIFSDLNQLVDLSMDTRYSDICGITQEELERDFEPEIAEVLKATGRARDEYIGALRRFYNGYRFSRNPVTVYNPFGILNHFDKGGEFSPWWYMTATPTFLIERLKRSDLEIPDLISGSIFAGMREILDSRITTSDPVPLFYQSGYLTIVGYEEKRGDYSLGFPNEEVKQAFLNDLLSSYIPKAGDMKKLYVGNFINDLQRGDLDGFMRRFAVLFESIPYDTRDPTEHYFQSIALVLWTLMGQFVQAELHTAKRRTDAVLVIDGTVYVFEFKVAKDETENAVDKALNQVEWRGYAKQYLSSGKRIVKVGAQYNLEKREMGAWKSIVE